MKLLNVLRKPSIGVLQPRLGHSRGQRRNIRGKILGLTQRCDRDWLAINAGEQSIFVRRVHEDHSTNIVWKSVVEETRKQPAQRVADQDVGKRLICPQEG